MLTTVFTDQSKVVTLMTRLSPHRRTSTMSGPMTGSTWAPLLDYLKAKVHFFICSFFCRLENLCNASLNVLL